MEKGKTFEDYTEETDGIPIELEYMKGFQHLRNILMDTQTRIVLPEFAIFITPKALGSGSQRRFFCLHPKSRNP